MILPKRKFFISERNFVRSWRKYAILPKIIIKTEYPTFDSIRLFVKCGNSELSPDWRGRRRFKKYGKAAMIITPVSITKKAASARRKLRVFI